MTRRIEITLLLALLLFGAALRITGITRLPPGFNREELTNLYVTQLVRSGEVASFYAVGETSSGREGLFPIMQSVFTGIVGDGLLPVRFISIACGLISIALAYAFGRRVYGQFVGLIAAFTLTVSIWPILLSRSAVRETLLLPLVLMASYILSAALHMRERITTETPQTPSYALLGILTGTLAYTHWTGLLFAPLLMIFLVYLIRTRQPLSRKVVGFMLFTFLIVLIVGIPYLAFTIRTPEVSGFGSFLAIRPESIGEFISNLFNATISPFTRGDASVARNMPGAGLLGPLGAILLLLGLIRTGMRWRWPGYGFLLLLFAVGTFSDAWSHGATNYRHSLLALPAIVLMVGIGAAFLSDMVRSLVRGRTLSDGVILGATAAGLFVSSLYAVHTLFIRWPASPNLDSEFSGRLGNLAIYLDRADDNLSTSICTFLLGTETGQVANLGTQEVPLMSDPVVLDLMMHRNRNDLRFSNCLTGFVLTTGGAPQRVAFTDPKAYEQLPPVFRDWLAKKQPIVARGLPVGRLWWVDAEQVVQDTFGQVILSKVDWPPEAPGASPIPVLPLRMGGYLTFEGYRVMPKIYKPGDMLTIATYWRADGEIVPGLRLFVHISRNPQTAPALQSDTLTIDASLLRDRDVFIQVHDILIPQDFPSGEYFVSVGAYSAETGDRLPMYDQDQERGNRLFLDKIAVASP